ncbi:MAG: hypothetical protein RSC66_11760, partial [Comamonas sp.]
VNIIEHLLHLLSVDLLIEVFGECLGIRHSGLAFKGRQQCLEALGQGFFSGRVGRWRLGSCFRAGRWGRSGRSGRAWVVLGLGGQSGAGQGGGQQGVAGQTVHAGFLGVVLHPAILGAVGAQGVTLGVQMQGKKQALRGLFNAESQCQNHHPYRLPYRRLVCL